MSVLLGIALSDVVDVGLERETRYPRLLTGPSPAGSQSVAAGRKDAGPGEGAIA
jgi:hypothetical protein